MRTISRLFDSHAEACRAAGALLAAGIPHVRIAVIGPYSDEIAPVLQAPALGTILGATAGLLACLSPSGVDLLGAGLLPASLAGAICGGVAGGLLGTFAAAAMKPDETNVAQGIILVTAQIDEDQADIAQAVLEDRAAKTGFAAEAA